jgi:hypothetical protein
VYIFAYDQSSRRKCIQLIGDIACRKGDSATELTFSWSEASQVSSRIKPADQPYCLKNRLEGKV